MSGSIDLALTLDDQKLIAGLLRSAGAQKKFTSEVEKTAAESKKADRELDRMADTVKKLTATPIEKYNSELRKLDDLAKKGKISTETHARAVAMQRAELDRMTVSSQKAAAATRDLGSGGKASILEMAGALGFATSAAELVSQTVQKIGQALAYSREQGKQAVAEMRQLSGADSGLLQISNTNEEFTTLKKEADDVADKTGMKREAAKRMLFDADSDGWRADYGQVAAGWQAFEDPTAAGKVAGQVPGMFAASGQKIGNAEAVSLTMKAAAKSRLSFEELSTGMVVGAEGAAKTGTTPEELAAATAVLAKEYKSGDTAGSRITEFSAMLAMDDRTKGKGIIGGFQAMKAMSAEDREGMLGRDQGRNLMYQSLEMNEQAIVDETAANAAERAAFQNGGGALRQKIAIAQADPEKTAERELNRSENRLARQKQQDLLQGGAERDIAVNEAEREQLQLKNKGIARGAAGLAAQGMSGLDASPNEIRAASVAASGTVKGVGQATMLDKAAFGQFAEAVSIFRSAVKEIKAANKMRHNAMQAEAMQPAN